MQNTSHISDLLSQENPSISFEFFPPKSAEASDRLFSTIHELKQLNPSFVSVTYGAGGSTRELTHKLVLRIMEETTIPAIPHLTCVNHSRAEISEILSGYANAEIPAILALRGDPPEGSPDYNRSQDAFCHAADLVSFIQNFNRETSNPRKSFGVGVAAFPEGHPDTQNRLKEMDHLRQKVDSGADYICTQLFFNNYSFLGFSPYADVHVDGRYFIEFALTCKYVYIRMRNIYNYNALQSASQSLLALSFRYHFLFRRLVPNLLS